MERFGEAERAAEGSAIKEEEEKENVVQESKESGESKSEEPKKESIRSPDAFSAMRKHQEQEEEEHQEQEEEEHQEQEEEENQEQQEEDNPTTPHQEEGGQGGTFASVCLKGHFLASFRTPTAGYLCDGAQCTQKQQFPSGFPIHWEIHGCRECDYDLCTSCVESANTQARPPRPPKFDSTGINNWFVELFERGMEMYLVEPGALYGSTKAMQVFYYESKIESVVITPCKEKSEGMGIAATFISVHDVYDIMPKGANQLAIQVQG